MFGIGPMEIAVIMIFALLFIGPHKLPEVARQLGKFMVHMKRMSSDVRNTVDEYMKQAEADILKEEREQVRKLFSEGVLNPLKAIDAEVKDSVNSAIQGHGESHPTPSHDEHEHHQQTTDVQAHVEGTVAATPSHSHNEEVGDQSKSNGPKWDT